MHSNTVVLDSLPHLATFSDFLLPFLFVLSMKFSVPYVLLIFHSMEHLNCHFASFLIGVRRVLSSRSRREKVDGCVFTCQLAWLNQNTTWSKTVSPLTFKVHSALVGLIRCRWNTDGLNIPHPRPSPEKPIHTHLRIPLLLAWQFWEDKEFHSR